MLFQQPELLPEGSYIWVFLHYFARVPHSSFYLFALLIIPGFNWKLILFLLTASDRSDSESFRQIADHVNLFAQLRHFQARERRVLMVSDGARKTQAVVRMYHNSAP